MSKQKLNAPPAISQKAQSDREMTQAHKEAFALVNSLDKLIREAGRVDRTACNRADVLAPITDLTMDLYDLGEAHGGIYEFPLTTRVVLWLNYVSRHPDLIRDEEAGMDFGFFDQPAYIKHENSLSKEGARAGITSTAESEESNRTGHIPVDIKAKGMVEGQETDEGSEGGAVDEDDDRGEAEEVKKVKKAEKADVEEEGDGNGNNSSDNEYDWEDAEGEDNEDDEMEIDGPAQRGPSRSSIPKRKTSDPIAYGDPNNPRKRSRTDLTADDETSLRDQPTVPGLLPYPVHCERCVESNNICYIPLRPKNTRTCDWCKRVKKRCSQLETRWLSKLSATEQESIDKAVATAIKMAPPLPPKTYAARKVKAEPRQVLLSDGGQHRNLKAKKGDKWQAKSKNSDQMQEGPSMKTRSKAPKAEVGPYPPPDSVEIPTLYSLTGEKINLQSLQPPVKVTLQVPAPQSTRTSLSPLPSGASERSNPKIVPPASPAERSVTEIAELFERTAMLDGGIADVQGQLRALERHTRETEAFRTEIELLKSGQEEVRRKLESFEAETKQKLEVAGKAIDSIDAAKQVELFEATAKRAGKLEVDQERGERASEETNEKLKGLQGQLDGFGGQIQALRQEATEREQQRSSELEQTVLAMQRSLQQTRDSEASPQQILETIQGLFKHQTDTFSQRFDLLNQGLNTLGVLLTHSNTTPHGGYLGSVPESRVVSTTITPKSIFQSPVPIPTHFTAEVPRILSSPAVPQSFSRDGGIMWPSSTSAVTNSDLDRQFTHYSTISSSTAQRSTPVGFIAGPHTSAASSHTTATSSDSSPSEHIQAPPSFWTGAKTLKSR